jgi:hypothetical protein
MRTLSLSPASHHPRVPSCGLHGLRDDVRAVASLTADFQIEDDAAEGQEGTFEGTRGDGSEESSEDGGARP